MKSQSTTFKSLANVGPTYMCLHTHIQSTVGLVLRQQQQSISN